MLLPSQLEKMSQESHLNQYKARKEKISKSATTSKNKMVEISQNIYNHNTFNSFQLKDRMDNCI